MGGRSTHTYNVGERVAGMTIQTSLLGQPIPIGWGRGRLSCNLIDYLGFQAIAHTTTTTQDAGGGKGGGGSTSTTDTTYTYSASVIFGICDGLISGINAVWKDAAYSTGAGSLAAVGLSVALGSLTQTPWSYLTSLFPDHALAYRGIAYAYASDYDLGSNGIVPNHSFEVDFAIQLNPGAGVHDADPKDILTDFFGNAEHGVPSWPSSANGNWADWSLYCRANNLLLSPVLDQQITASEFVRRLMDITHSECAFTEGVLKIKPLGDASATGNGVTWNPNLTPVYNLSERDFDDEVAFSIDDQASAYNYVQVEYLDRTNQYQTAIAIAHDLGDILTFGRRQQTPQEFHDIADPQIARNVAQLWLQRALYIRGQFHFDLPMDFVLLEPLDYVALTTIIDGMQLNGQLCMIREIEEDEEGDDTLHFVAEELPGHTASHAAYADHRPYGVGVDVNVAPGAVATPFIFNAPQALAPNGYEAWAAVSGTNANWGGAIVWASFDGTNYTAIGQANAPARYGVLSSTLATHPDPDSANTLAVDLSISKGALSTVTTAEADAGATICWVDGELISFGTATLTSTSHYNLTYLRRGQQGSAIGAHSSGTHFVRLDGAIFKYPYLAQHAGKTMHVKFQSYNVYGRALEDLSTCTDYTITLSPTGSTPVLNAAGLALADGGSTWTGNQIHMVCNTVANATSYRWDFYKSNGTTLCNTLTTSGPDAYLSYAAAAASSQGSQRSYKVAVTPVNAAGNGPTSSQVAITNAAPAAVGSPATSGSTATDASITCTASSDPDLAGYIVFYSTTSGFNPVTAGDIMTAVSPTVNIYGLAAATYYCKIAAYDPWSANPGLLNLSAQMTFTITAGGGGSPSGGGGSGYTGAGGGGLVHPSLP